MQTLPRTNVVVIEDFDRMTTLDEDVNCTKPTHLLSMFSLNLRAPFSTSTFGAHNLETECGPRGAVLPQKMNVLIC
jgi:hypothetical protein